MHRKEDKIQKFKLDLEQFNKKHQLLKQQKKKLEEQLDQKSRQLPILSKEEYLSKIGEDNDLGQMYVFLQMVYAKYM